MYISYHLEPLLEKFNHLKHVTFSILIEEKEPWEPRTLVNTVTELREKGIRVSVFLDWGTRQVVKPAGGGKIDVSSYFDEPTEEEINLYKIPIKCSAAGNPRLCVFIQSTPFMLPCRVWDDCKLIEASSRCPVTAPWHAG